MNMQNEKDNIVAQVCYLFIKETYRGLRMDREINR